MSGALTSAAVVELLRETLATGDVGKLAAAHAEDGLLEVSVQGERWIVALRSACEMVGTSRASAARLLRIFPTVS